MSVEQAVTTDPRVLPRERCVTRYLLDDLAKTQPEKEFAVFEDGEVWSEVEFIDVDTTKDNPDKSFSKIINHLTKLKKI